MKILLLFGISIIFLSGCSIIGMGIGIAAQDYEKFKPLYDIDSIKAIEPGTKVIIQLQNDEKIEGSFQYINELFKAGYKPDTENDSVYQKGYWELFVNVNSKDEIFNSNEIKMIEEFSEEGNYAIPIGLGIGIVMDIIMYLLWQNNPIDLQ